MLILATGAAALVTLWACRAPPRSPSCDVATYLCLQVPCDDGGAQSVDNCPPLGLPCAVARDACPQAGEVGACLDALAGPTLTCNDADACFTRHGCRWVGVLPSDGGSPVDAGSAQGSGLARDGGSGGAADLDAGTGGGA